MLAMAFSRPERSRDAEGFMLAATSEATILLPNFETESNRLDVELSDMEPSGKPW
jgi:hypothetical protein